MSRGTNTTVQVESITIKTQIPVPRRGKKAPETDNVQVEVYGYCCRLWNLDHCGTSFRFTPEPPSRSGYTSPVLADMPHLDAIYRIAANQYVANRTNMVGGLLLSAVQAMESAIAERDGSSVYFASAGPHVKIGWSKRVSTRLSKLQTGSATPISLLATTPGGRALEQQLHEQFAHLHISGEWFHAAPDLMEHIMAITTATEHAAAS